MIVKPFKAPTPLGPKRDLAMPGRKRKAVSYKEAGGGKDDDGDGDAGSPKKKSKFAMGNKEYGDDGVLGDMAKWCNRKFPVYQPKEKGQVFGKR